MRRFHFIAQHLAPRTPVKAFRGFTVIELLVAAVITAVIAGFIVTIVSNVSGFWTRTSGKLSTEAQARYVLDQLFLDLSSAIYRDDSNVWFSADVLDRTNNSGLWQLAAASNAKPASGVSLSMASASIADARFGQAGVWLRFFTTKRGNNSTADATTFSAPVAVGYQIIRRFSSPSSVGLAATKTAYLLHRAEVRPATASGRSGVLESGYNIAAADYSASTISTTNTNSGATTGDPRSIQIPGSRTNLGSVIADNVIDFGIRCYVRDSTQPDGLRVIFPALAVVGAGDLVTLRPGYSIRPPHPTWLRSSLPSTSPVTATNFDSHFPDVVDVMVRILTDEGARLISTYEQANSPLSVPQGVNAQQYWWQLAIANSQVFTRRIVLNAKPL